MRSLWFLLAACASSLLLATTNLLCQEITSVPLLWVLPLALYLLSFILCFDNPRWYSRAVFQPLYALSLLAVCAALIFGPARLVLVPLTLFLTAMVCHGELARLKPSVEQLTSFYLTIACGGAAGGVFVAVVAPLVFRTFIEFHLSLAASAVLALICLGRDAESWLFERRFWLPAAISIGALLAGFAGSLWIEDLGKYLTSIRYYPSVLLVGFVAVMGSLATNNAAEPSRRGLRFMHILVVCGVLSILASLYWTTRPLLRPLLKERNFYGAIRVESTKKGRILMHGATLHGAQLDPPFDKLPVAYYGPDSGIGTLLSGHPKRHSYPGNLRIGVIGLGVGTLSAYGRQGDYIRYYELDPNVVNLSLSQKPAFTYVRNSPARIDVALGDGRLLLEEEAARGELQYFDVLVLDAFSGDAIPVHLLTKEAFETYWQHVNPDSGIIAIHVSSRHVNLLPVALGIAEHFRASSVISMHEATDPFWTSWWVLLARRPATLAIPGLGQLILPDRIPTPSRLWTDDQSDIFRLIR